VACFSAAVFTAISWKWRRAGLPILAKSAVRNKPSSNSLPIVRGAGGRERLGMAFPRFFHVFVCSVMKVSSSWNADLKISLRAVKNSYFLGCVPALLFQHCAPGYHSYRPTNKKVSIENVDLGQFSYSFMRNYFRYKPKKHTSAESVSCTAFIWGQWRSNPLATLAIARGGTFQGRQDLLAYCRERNWRGEQIIQTY